RGLNLSPDAAHYLAWFCPQEKGYFDSRWPLFDGVAEDYVRMREGLLAPQSNSLNNEWNRRLLEQQIDHIVLYDPDGERMERAFRNLIQDEEHWQLVALEGSSALFIRSSSAGSPKPFDPSWAAYHAEPVSLAPLTAPRAPKAPGLLDALYRPRDFRNP